MFYKHIKKKPTAATLVFIHGFLGSYHDWTPVVDTLKNNVNCLLIDLPGHGKSTWDTTVCFSMIAYQIVQILNKEKIDKIILVGYSLGGRIALHFTHHYPRYIQELVLISTHLGLSTPQERMIRYHADYKQSLKMTSLLWSQFLSEWYKSPLFNQLRLSHHQVTMEKVLRSRQHHSPQIMAQVLLQLSLSVQPNYTRLFLKSSFPIHYLCGQHDDKFYTLSKGYTSFLTLYIHSDADHALHLMYPEWVSLFLDEILVPCRV
jgi:2-succinyl-6-hydroxy-2,4-cyclohexadiene-1-carboxylate synthase